MDSQVVIVGGGISGLSAAWYLNRAGFRATLIDKSPQLGGVIRTVNKAGCLIETGPDSFLASKPWALDLIREVGLGDQVINSNDHLRVTYILKGGKLVPLPAGLMMMVPTKIAPLIGTRLLGWRAKLGMALELFRRPKGRRPDRSVAEFLLDHYGREALDYLAEPLLSGVFGGDPKLLSADSVLTRFVEIEAKYGSLSRGVLAAPKPKGAGAGGSLFRTLKFGLGSLVDKLAPAADWIAGEAQAIERAGAGWRVRVNGSWMGAERVLIAAPAYAAGKLVAPFNGELGATLGAIPYNSSLTMALIYDKANFNHPLKGFGFLVPKRERGHLKACTWVNNKFDYRAPQDKVLLRCFMGGESYGEGDATLVQAAQDELRAIMGLQAKPVAWHIARWPDSMAQYTVGHARRVERIDALMSELPGLSLAGNGYRGIGVPDCIHSGKQAAEKIAQSLHTEVAVGGR